MPANAVVRSRVNEEIKNETVIGPYGPGGFVGHGGCLPAELGGFHGRQGLLVHFQQHAFPDGSLGWPQVADVQ